MLSILGIFRDLLMHIFPKPIAALLTKSADFVFIIHPRHHADIFRQYPFLRFAPYWFNKWFSLHLWPVLGPVIEGIKDRDGKEITGRVIFCPLTAHQLFKDLARARDRIRGAIFLGEKLSPKVIGLGALSASVMRGKWDVLDRVGALITSGSIFTSVLLRQESERLAERTRLKLKNATVAVVGAAGLVGSLVSKLLAERVGRLILVDRRLRIAADLGKKLGKKAEIPVEVTKDLAELRKADLIVAATNAIAAVLDPVDLPPGSLIIDDSRPTSTPLDLMKLRPDVVVVEGGVIRLPGMKCSFDFGLISQDEIFGCLAETILLCQSGMYERLHLEGKTDLEMACELEKLSEELGYESAEFQWQGKSIDTAYLENIQSIRSSASRRRN